MPHRAGSKLRCTGGTDRESGSEQERCDISAGVGEEQQPPLRRWRKSEAEGSDDVARAQGIGEAHQPTCMGSPVEETKAMRVAKTGVLQGEAARAKTAPAAYACRVNRR